MLRNGQKFGIFALIFSLAAPLVLASNADAARKRVPGEYAYTSLPYWRVGALNRQLSNACQRGEFGQRKYLLSSIGFVGKVGQTLTGIATTTWNLYDPKGLAEPRKTYHFFNQGYSNCKVYVADQPRRRN